ncbi:Hypothetical predicted protein [Mytilus galloprovincialis]|uniref:LRAT domain-containing protein n=1 Tax=Mytilus galloprovincialis TaxID=29158 RepID=A0A8B6GKX4_MYTGA|nr:Hypothetical predicted protein [Mytilus galloprovincialis]
MAAKLLAIGNVSSWRTSFDEQPETPEELIQIFKDDNPDFNRTIEDEKKEAFLQTLQDSEADFLRMIEDEKRNRLVEEITIESIPSKIKEAIENIDIESYIILDDDNEPPLPPNDDNEPPLQPNDDNEPPLPPNDDNEPPLPPNDDNEPPLPPNDDNEPPLPPNDDSFNLNDVENIDEKPPQEELSLSFCTYCTKYERIKTVCDIKRGDSIRFQRFKGMYYHHATVKYVKKTNDPTSCDLTLIHLQKFGKRVFKTKVTEDEKNYNFKKTVIEKVIYQINPFSPDEIVQRAEKYITQNQNEKIYNVIGNNCEHVSSLLTQGISVSHQVISKWGQAKSGIIWLFDVLCKLGSTIMRFPGFATIGNLYSVLNTGKQIKKLKNYFAQKIVCSPCFLREYKTLKIALTTSVIGLALSVISHLNWVTLSLSMIVGIAFPMCAPLVTKYVMPLVQPAFLIPKHKMSAQNIPKAGDVVTFDYCSLPHEGIVTEVCGNSTDAKLAKATIVHFPWPGLFERYTVAEEDIYLKLTGDVFVVDHSSEDKYWPPEVVYRAKKQVGEKNHNNLTYRSSHLARYCKTGEKTLKELPKKPVKSIEDVSPGDVIEFKYFGLSHEAVVIVIGYAQNVEMKIVHYKYNCALRGLQIVEEKITFSFSNENNLIHEYESADTYEAEEVVRRARSRIGEKKFNVFKNRSSHLAKWCKLK